MNSKFLASSLLCVVLLQAQSPVLKPYESVEPHMGTLFRIKLYAFNEQSAQTAFQLAFARVAQLDKTLSDYQPDSELNLATKSAALHPVRVSDDLFALLAFSQEISVETGGAFDITVGPLTKLWRQARKEGHIPPSEAIVQAKQKCGYRKLHLDSTARTITVDAPDMQLDLGGIAKGYAADKALEAISAFGIQSALVAASGDLAFSDPPPGEVGWKIGVDSLDRADEPFSRVLLLANSAVSTSGGSEQFLESEGKRYSHIINPATGLGIVSDITVTTVSRHGLLADPAATAVSVLGCEKGLAFVERHPELAAFILENSGTRSRVIESRNFASLRTDKSSQ